MRWRSVMMGSDMSKLTEARNRALEDINAGRTVKKIRDLESRVAELEAENARITTDVTYYRNSYDSVCIGINRERDQLLLAQAEIKRLRDAVEAVCCDPDGSVCIGLLGGCYADKEVLEQALAQPSDTSALDAYVADKVKEATLPIADQLQKERLQAITDFGQYQEAHDQITTLTRQRDLAVEALERIYHTTSSPMSRTYAEQALEAIKESETKDVQQDV